MIYASLTAITLQQPKEKVKIIAILKLQLVSISLTRYGLRFYCNYKQRNHKYLHSQQTKIKHKNKISTNSNQAEISTTYFFNSQGASFQDTREEIN